ncbi:ABC transporter permease [Dactylosporangium sp. CA-092794]|uniref:ABC transporter permease n=1 Tax=Dactylosporangium sp. CA-092794 TaxID=3239929 RepID=UPI003D92B53A
MSGPSRAAAMPTTESPWERGDLSATLYREMILLTHNRTNLLLAVTPTIIYIVLFATSLARLVPHVRYHDATIAYPDFAVPGLMFSSLLAASASAATALFQERMGNMTVELWSTPLSRPRYVAAKLLAGAGLVTVQAVGALAAAALVFQTSWAVDRWLTLLAGAVAASFAFNGLYLLLAIYIREFQRFMVLVNIVTPVLLFGSPAFYPAAQMAPPLRFLAHFNPVTYGVASLRDGLVFGFGTALPSILLMAGVAVVTGLIVGRALRRGAQDV